MALLPNFDALEEYFESTSQYRWYLALQFGLIGLYTVLLCFLVTNTWRILIKMRRWRTAPLTFFYVMAFIAALSRLLALIWTAEQQLWVFYLEEIQPIAKFCVGAIQSWIVFELALRLKKESQAVISGQTTHRELDKKIKKAQVVVIALISAFFLAYAIYDYIWLLRQLNGDPTHQRHQKVSAIILGFYYLLIFFTMLGANIFLIVQISIKQSKLGNFDLEEEKTKLYITLFFFELSYLTRAVWDIILPFIDLNYAELIIYDFIVLLDGLSFLVLVLIHKRNFSRQILSDQAFPRAYSTETNSDEVSGLDYLVQRSQKSFFTHEDGSNSHFDQSRPQNVSGKSYQDVPTRELEASAEDICMEVGKLRFNSEINLTSSQLKAIDSNLNPLDSYGLLRTQSQS